MAKKKPKEIKIEFAPGCFDAFEGTQEELDALQTEIMEMFAGMTPEEIEEQSQPVDIDELAEELTHEQFKQVISALTDNGKRKLQ